MFFTKKSCISIDNKRRKLFTNSKERFLELCSEIKRKVIDELVKYLENSDFFYCPANTRFHGAHSGGLLKHSLNVYDELVRVLAAYPEIKA